ncbi:MAG: hypothetical protein Q9168_002601 [Polycauliona sp. 1 TL-2023]
MSLNNKMPPRKFPNFTNISSANIINNTSPGGRRHRSGDIQLSTPPSSPFVRTQISPTNIIGFQVDGPDSPRKTRHGGAVPTSGVARTVSTREEMRHDPMTPRDRAARQKRTSTGQFARKGGRRRERKSAEDGVQEPEVTQDAGGTQEVEGIQETEDTQDEEDPLSKPDDHSSPSTPLTPRTTTRTPYNGPTTQEILRTLEEESFEDSNVAMDGLENKHENSDLGRLAELQPTPSCRKSSPEPTILSSPSPFPRTPYKGPTARGMLGALEESIEDEDMVSGGQGNDQDVDMAGDDSLEPSQPAPSSLQESSAEPTITASPFRTPYKGPTAREMLGALDESVKDDNVVLEGQEDEVNEVHKENDENKVNEEENEVNNGNSDLVRNTGSVESQPAPSSSRQSSPKPATTTTSPSSFQIHHPQIPAPPQPSSNHQRTSSPQDHLIRLAQPPKAFNPRLPLQPTSSYPGVVLQPPSRSQTPMIPMDPEMHQPNGADTLVPREGGYRPGQGEEMSEDSHDENEDNGDEKEVSGNEGNRDEEEVSGDGEEVSGDEEEVGGDEEEVNGDEEEVSEDSHGENEGNGDEGDVNEVSGRDDQGMNEFGEEQELRSGWLRGWSEPSSVGDPRDTTLEELDALMEGY